MQNDPPFWGRRALIGGHLTTGLKDKSYHVTFSLPEPGLLKTVCRLWPCKLSVQGTLWRAGVFNADCFSFCTHRNWRQRDIKHTLIRIDNVVTPLRLLSAPLYPVYLFIYPPWHKLWGFLKKKKRKKNKAGTSLLFSNGLCLSRQLSFHVVEVTESWRAEGGLRGLEKEMGGGGVPAERKEERVTSTFHTLGTSLVDNEMQSPRRGPQREGIIRLQSNCFWHVSNYEG